ncbi:cadherin-like domain-containing protein, partial [Cognatazoarcus halotolerans]|uniref:cadherin-like domain-containing protein n=1 Tax=Cognatazoarcus halotolerans TaxID=2686016 RepID=UPI00135803EC
APAFDVTVNDGSADSNTLSATISYTPVNDVPVVTSASLTVSEGQTITLGAGNFGVADPDSASFTYTVSGVSGGYFQLSSASGTPVTSFTSAD